MPIFDGTVDLWSVQTPRGVHPPKPMMHIAYSPYFHKNYKFPYYRKIYVFPA